MILATCSGETNDEENMVNPTETDSRLNSEIDSEVPSSGSDSELNSEASAFGSASELKPEE